MPAPGHPPADPNPPFDAQADPGDALGRERWELLRQIDALLVGPMVVLSFIWIVLTIVDFTRGLGRTLSGISYLIWALFALQFLIGMVIAPRKLTYARHNWLTALALVLPAFRVLRAVRALRLLRAARAVRSVSLLRLFTTLNRGMRAVNRIIGHRGIGYVLLLTAMVTFGGAAGMASFESPAALGQPGAGLDGYGEALWWTAMTMTTMGSDYFPRTLEGRVLGWLLAVYAFSVFGYITATIASLFISRDAAAASGGSEPIDGPAGDRPPDAASELGALRQEVAALRTQVLALTEVLAPSSLDTDGADRVANRARGAPLVSRGAANG
jgi:voltage-gated potassium channel